MARLPILIGKKKKTSNTIRKNRTGICEVHSPLKLNHRLISDADGLLAHFFWNRYRRAITKNSMCAIYCISVHLNSFMNNSMVSLFFFSLCSFWKSISDLFSEDLKETSQSSVNAAFLNFLMSIFPISSLFIQMDHFLPFPPFLPPIGIIYLRVSPRNLKILLQLSQKKKTWFNNLHLHRPYTVQYNRLLMEHNQLHSYSFKPDLNDS